MKNDKEMVLGIDIGGNHVKLGFVNSEGNITDFQSYPTKEWRDTGNFAQRLIDTIAFKLIAHKDVKKVGIGLPGMLSKDRLSPLEITAIPELNGLPLAEQLRRHFPGMQFFLENDANAAALGEFHFSSEIVPDTYAFITLGTGIGSAAIIDRKIFTGGDGNGLELGHILSRNGKRLEQNIGKNGILEMATNRLAEYRMDTTIPRDQPVSATRMVAAADAGDAFSIGIFEEVGEMLGEGLVALIRILDIKNIYLGGGLSASYDSLVPGIRKVLEAYLTPYYLNNLKIRRAALGNDAGLLGAASLCLD